MNRPQRVRTRAGKPDPSKGFHCRYGNHYTWTTAFESLDENNGICLDCAYKVHSMLRGVMLLPDIEAKRVTYSYDEWRSYLEKSAEIKRLRAGSNDPGWVYYISQGDLIKIGYAKDVRRRMRAYGPTAELLAVHPGTVQLEREMHKKFRSTLARGREWFTITEELIGHVQEVVDKFGNPSIFAYEYTTPKTEEQKVRDQLKTRPYTAIAN